MIYVSIVGNQPGSVFNPLVALKKSKKYGMPGDIYLLATAETLERARQTRKILCEKHSYRESSASIIEISDSLSTDEVNGWPPVQDVVSRIISDTIGDLMFNISGGLAFQIGVCARVINSPRCTVIYPEAEDIHVFKINDRGVTEHDTLPSPEPVDVLELQGIDCKTLMIYDNNPLLDLFVSRYNIRIPNGVGNIKIDDVVFDRLWNLRNRLKFLKVIHNPDLNTTSDETLIEEARKVVLLATTKEGFKDLYYRDIAVLTNHRAVSEIIRTESRNKVIALDMKNDNKLLFNKNLQDLFGISSTANMDYVGSVSYDIQNAEVSNKGKILYTPIGSDISTSVIALWSHRPECICFLYTPNDYKIITIRDSILRYKDLLPSKRIIFRPVTIVGDDIFDMKKEDGYDRIEVNITPGTKGHTFFLALWTKNNGAHIYSIETKQQMLVNFNTGTRELLEAPTPLTFLRLSGRNVKQEGQNIAALKNKKPLCEAILEFMRMMLSEGKDIGDFPSRELILKGARFTPVEDECAQISFSNENKITWSLKGDQWFKELIGYVITDCNADDVHVMLQTGWSEAARESLSCSQDNEGGENCKNDIDVVARFDAGYYMISCKTTGLQKEDEAVSEANSSAGLFGRFCVPLVAFLGYDGNPKNSKKTYIFGHKTFTNRGAMKTLLENARAERQKTRHRPKTVLR